MAGWIGATDARTTAAGVHPRILPLVGALAALLASVLPSAAWSDDFYSQSTRKPFGVYAHVDFESMLPEMVGRFPSIQISQTTTQSCAVVTAASPSDLASLHFALQDFYTILLSDEALSGITMGMHWCRVQVQEPNKANSACPTGSREQPCNPDGNDWSYVDDLFTAVHKYNATNKAAKTIQLIVTPGVYSPSWLTDGSILKSCDGLFTPHSSSSLSDCGMVTFNPYPEQRNALDPPGALLILPTPLPWNSQYLAYWGGFVEDVAARYGTDQALVAVVIAGPSCATTEMIIPTSANSSPQQSGLDVDYVWKKLIANSFPNNKTYAMYPAQAFVDYWELTIRGFEQIFANANLTFILTPDDYKSMPELPLQPLTNELKQEFVNFYNDDCYDAQFQNPPLPLSCQTKATIAFYFLTYAIPRPIGGNIARGTSVGGMTASSYSATGKIDVPGVKLLAARWSPFTPSGTPVPGGPLLGGAEFDFGLTRFDLSDNSYNPKTSPPVYPVGDHFQEEACIKSQSQPCSNDSSNNTSVEQGAFQVFANFFNGTEAAYLFNAAAYTQIDGATMPPTQFQAPIQYVDVAWEDVMYAVYTAGNCALAGTTPSTQFVGPTLMQDVLNQAKYGLEIIAHAHNAQQPQLTCASSP
jgi:hypothetical protein